MGERFTGQTCDECGGGLKYNKPEKYWECPYCGKVYERELRFNKVQIDGLAGINDLVRSTLSKAMNLDFQGAERDLQECEKIDHTSVGTLIAQIAIPLLKSLFTKDRQTEIAKVNSLLPKLNREFPDIDDPEEILYEFINSADIYAYLVVVYSMTGQTKRKAFVEELLSYEEVFNQNIARCLLNTLLKEGKTAEADTIIKSLNNANAKYALMYVLTMYPAGEAKVAHVGNLLKRCGSEFDSGKMFDSYFEKDEDDSLTVIGIFLEAAGNNVGFETSKVIHSVLKYCDDIESATKTFNALAGKRLDEASADAVMDWATYTCTNTEVSQMAFDYLFKSNSVFEVTDEDLIELLSCEQEEDVKASKFIQMLNSFKISGKNLDKVFAYHMVQNEGGIEYRQRLFDDISGRLVSIPLSVIEDYVLKTEIDGVGKPAILKAAFAKLRTASLATSVFSAYLKCKTDDRDTRENVIKVFLDNKIVPDASAFNHYILNSAEKHTDEILLAFTKTPCRAMKDTFEKYILSLTDYSKYNPYIADIATRVTFELSTKAFTNYLLYVTEGQSRKVANMKRYYSAVRGDLRSIELTFHAQGVKIQGNLAQAYFFLSNDEAYVMQEILAVLDKDKIKPDEPVVVISDDKRVKFKKFLSGSIGPLDTKHQTLIDEYL